MGEKKRYIQLDALKGLSAIIIACFYHLGTVPFPYENGLPLQNNLIVRSAYINGGYLVELFFLISGFLSYAIYQKKIEEGMKLGVYIKKRLVRIYPLLWITLLFTLLGTIVYAGFQPGETFYQLSNNTVLTFGLGILGLQDLFYIGQSWNCPAWTITHFIVCWIIFWWIVHLSGKRRDIVFFFTAMMIAFGCYYQIWDEKDIFLLNYGFSRGCIAFFTGGFVWLIQSVVGEERKRKDRAVISSIVWLGLLLCVRLTVVENAYPSASCSLFLFPAVMLIVMNGRILEKILCNKFFSFIGEISFSLYLCNYPVQVFIACLYRYTSFEMKASSAAFLLFHAVLNIIVAIVVHYAAEKWLRRRLLDTVGSVV